MWSVTLSKSSFLFSVQIFKVSDEAHSCSIASTILCTIVFVSQMSFWSYVISTFFYPTVPSISRLHLSIILLQLLWGWYSLTLSCVPNSKHIMILFYLFMKSLYYSKTSFIRLVSFNTILNALFTMMSLFI